MGRICDRSKGHLAASDAIIIALRRVLFEGIDAVARGEAPRGTDAADYRAVHGSDEILDRGEMPVPKRRPPAFEPLDLALPPRRIRPRVIEDRLAPGRRVGGIEIFRHVAADLAQRRQIAAQRRHPERQRFRDRQAEPFGERGKERGARAGDDPRHPCVGNGVALNDEIARRALPADRAHHVTHHPAALADEDETRRALAELRLQSPPDVEQQEMILLRLNGGDEREIGRVMGFGLGRREQMRLDPERRDQNGRRVSVSEYRGRPLIVTFVDPLCRNLCPLEAKLLNQVVGGMPASQRPAILAVSVDVYADARANLLQDERKWELVPQWRWAVGRPAQLAAVWKRYLIGVSVTTKKIDRTTINYITHTEAAYIIDATGHERALFLWPFYPQDVQRTLQQLS